MFVDMIVDIESNKKLIPIATEFFLSGKKSIFYLFLYHSIT